MTTNNKYFTPNIEDIYTGYEYEFHGMTVGGLFVSNEDGTKDINRSVEPHIKVWTKEICGLGFWDRKPEDVIELIKTNQIRVPYLTKEQIKAEIKNGFELKESERYGIVLLKGNYFFAFRNIQGGQYWTKEGFKEHGYKWNLTVIPIDPSKEFNQDYSPKINMPIKDINTLRYICKLLNI